MSIFVFIDVIHKFTRDHYSKRFPELESLVPTPLEYIRTVQVKGSLHFYCAHFFLLTKCKFIPGDNIANYTSFNHTLKGCVY